VLNAWQFFHGGGETDGFMVAWDYSATPTTRQARPSGTAAELLLWPVPARHSIQARLPQSAQAAWASIYDALGRQVYQQAVQGTSFSLNLQQLSAGYYQMQVRTLDGRLMRAPFIRMAD
jgi:hypothetical protein